jgi:hypothetical protein
MSKTTVTRLFIGGVVAVTSGAILAIAAVWIAIANNVFVMNGPDIVALRGSALAWSLLGFGAAGGLAVVVGVVTGVVASIGALVNTWQLESKAWFIALLLLGIFSLGFFAMIAYILAGPDGTRGSAARTPQLPAQATPA